MQAYIHRYIATDITVTMLTTIAITTYAMNDKVCTSLNRDQLWLVKQVDMKTYTIIFGVIIAYIASCSDHIESEH